MLLKPQYYLACLIAGLLSTFQSLSSDLDSLLIRAHSSSLGDFEKYKLCIAIAQNSQASADTILKYSNTALTIAEIHQKEHWFAPAYSAIGEAYKLKGVLDEAMKSYLMALKYYKENFDPIAIGSVYSNIADIYATQNNFPNSSMYYQRAKQTFQKNADTLRLASVLLNLGEMYRIFHHYDSALIYLKTSEKYFDDLNYPIGMAYNLGNIGLVYNKQGRIDSAIVSLEYAINILEKIGDYYPVAVYQTALADIYARKEDFKLALNFAHSALTISEEEGLKEQIRDASLKLSELYQTQGDYRKAYDFQSQYITYRDSINNEEVIRKMADLRTEYEVSQKQIEVDLKQTEVDLLNVEARNNQIVLWSVIVVLILVLCLTYALLKVYRVKVRAVRIVRQRRRIIAAQRDQLEDVNKTKDKFFSIISHDIRGPISNFQGVSQLIHLLVESKDYDGLLKLGTMLDTSTKEVSTLLDNLLEWAMSQQGRMPYKPEEIKLHELCNSNLSIMENLATAKQIELTQQVKEKVTINADKNSVSTIVRNLLSNAIKFTPEEGTVTLNLSYDLNMAVITVKDSGIGIPKDKMEHLFDFKGERTSWGTSGEKGVGLGLTLIHEFVDLNKGKIEVESEEGKGTSFRVYLPLLSK